MRSRSLARLPLLVSCLAVPALVGCSPTSTERFDVTVRNDTPNPLTLALVKDGPPYEAAWATPEDFAIDSAHRREDWAGKTGRLNGLPPGKTAEVRGLTGQFEAGTRAFLRVYNGDLTVSQMLSKGPDSPDRVDVILVPGANELTVVPDGSAIKVRVDRPGPVVAK